MGDRYLRGPEREGVQVPDLPNGIYWDKGTTPPRCYGIAFLKAKQRATAAEIHEVLKALVQLWTGLKVGRAPTLAGTLVPPSEFEWLLAFGRKAFEIEGALHPIPRKLRAPNTFNSIDPLGGGLAVDGSGLRFATGLAQNVATEEFCVQFTGSTPLSVARAIVETSLLLEGLRNPETGKAPLLLSASFTGFNREDRRSWIDFHDGLSNLVSGAERKSVIETKRQGLTIADRWFAGGTYMAFVRLKVDVRHWRLLAPAVQEAVVGRTRITGCPVIAVDAAGAITPIAGCPAPGTTEVDTQDGNTQFLEPPDGVDPVAGRSHVQRANHHSPKHRIYRQGYEFFENSAPGRPFEIGLNFVSFQESPDRLFFILKQPGWLGRINFGGDTGPEIQLVEAGAVFLCPPIVEGEAYPGASTFSEALVA
jgi:hypothetical protein